MPRLNVGRDLTYAWRRLRATPLFTTFAVLTLAAGIGVTTAVYSIVRATLAPPSDVREPESLVYLFHIPCCSEPINSLSWPDFQDFRSRQEVFEGVTAFRGMRSMAVAPGGAETVLAEVVSGDYFSVLGVNASLGRALQPQDDVSGSSLVMVLSHRLWQRLFGGSTDVIGKSVRMGGHVFEVVGVAPKEFRGLANNGLTPSALWIPLQSAPLFPELGMAERGDRDDRNRRWLHVVGRLKPHRGIDEAATEASLIAKQLDAAFPIGEDLDRRFRIPYAISRPWAVRSVADLKINVALDETITWLAGLVMGAVGLVLMVVCTNLANLLLARGSLRRHESTVRLALGASRWRLAREALVEEQLDLVGGTVAMLLHHDLCAIMHALHLVQPMGVLRRARLRLARLQIIFLAEHEHHDVGVLFDRAGFTQIRKDRPFVVAIVDAARKL